jgi:hypothetical protein
MLRIVEYYFLYSSNLKCSSREKTPKKPQKTKQNKKTQKHLSCSDPNHVVKRKGSLNMARQEKTN